jgi:hypothetical protein
MTVPDGWVNIVRDILHKAGNGEVSCRLELHEHAEEWAIEVAKLMEEDDRFYITGSWDNDE